MKRGYIMKVWKILDYSRESKQLIACYVKVSKSVYDSSWYALQLARETINKDLCTTQLLDVERGEQMEENIPVLEIL